MPVGLIAAPGDEFAEITRAGWRELGFWYACDVGCRQWRFRADRNGLRAFAAEVRQFLASTEREKDENHIHLGPLCSLRLIRASEPLIDWRGISGSRADWERFLAELHALAEASGTPRGLQPFATVFTREEGFSATIEIEAEGFDPASADE